MGRMIKALRVFSSSYVLGLLVLGVVVFSTCAEGLFAVEVCKERPRMLVRGEDLPALRAKCNGAGKEMFDGLKRRVDELLGDKATLDNNGRFNMPACATVYLITGDERYAEKAKEWLELLSKTTIQNSWTCLEYIPVAAITYDWIYPTLSGEEKERFADGMIRQVERIKTMWRHSDYNNHFLLEYMSQLHVALTLANEEHHQEVWKAYLAESENWLKKHVIPAMNEMGGDDGGDAEGFGYSNWGVGRPLSLLLLAWRTATGENVFDECSFMQWIPRWNIYGRKPDGTMCRSEDCSSTHRWDQGVKSTFSICAAAYGDEYAQWAQEQIKVEFPHLVWRSLIPWDTAVASTPPSNLPLATLFRPLGHVFTRSSWDDPGASWGMFQCGPIFAGHQHTDNNSFVIFKRGNLAIDTGVYDGSSHRPNYHSRTIAHNTILVYDKDEVFTNNVWDADGEGGSNDGGQRRVNFPVRVTASAAEKAVRDVGKITAFKDCKEYCYACGDASKSYSSKKLKNFTRQFVHLRPDTFVVFDRVDATSASYPKTWLLHSMDEPLFDSQSSSFAVEYGGGRLDVWTLLPKEAKTETVGGPGKEFWVDGKNYPPDGRDGGAGAWRVEVKPENDAETELFLHVLYASDADKECKLPNVSLKSVDKTNVVVEISGENDKALLTFGAEGQTGGHITIIQNGKKVISEALPREVILPEREKEWRTR